MAPGDRPEPDEHSISGARRPARNARAPLGTLNYHHLAHREATHRWIDPFELGPRRRRGTCKSLSNEYAPYNVLVNNVCPGYTATDRLGELSSTLAKSAGVTAAEIASRWTASIPLGRL